MKKSSRRRPGVEPLESMMLLTAIVPSTLSAPALAAIHPANLVRVDSMPKVPIVALADLAAPRPSTLASTSRPAVNGLAIAPAITGQAARPAVRGLAISPTASTATTRRPAIVSFGAVSKAALAKGTTVHAMVIAGSKPVSTGQASHPVVVAATLTKSAGQLQAGPASKGPKVS